MTAARGRWRRLWLGLQTVSGFRTRGYFAPSAAAVHADPEACRSPVLEARFAARSDAMRTWLARMAPYAAALRSIGEGSPPAPRWSQDWFPRLDAAMAYTIVRTLRPRRIVEVGSGHSTRFYATAIADEGLAAELLSIDPAPRAALAGVPGLRAMAMPVQRAGPEPFRALAAGDILSIDSSHILMPGSDVDFLLNAVLPVLPPGVLVHFHDIFLPDAYPAAWSWRGYNEQSAVALLVQQAGWGIEFASHYAVTRLGDAVRDSAAGALPLLPGALESSLWLTST
ncbi:MAG: class I SAM-dependent methyltransferase [Alphaproteobacteria bacterium]